MKGNYKIGYGKPPRHTRFKRGASGNPRGRPKGVRNFKTHVQATLHAPVKLTRDGQQRRVSTQEALLLRLREKALNGDVRALDRLLQLAQQYNNEELAASPALSTDDENVLEIYRSRVLGRLISSSETTKSKDGSETISRARSSSVHSSEQQLPKRVTVKRYHPSGDNKPNVRNGE